MVPMLSLVYLFYFLMISWLLSKKRVDFMYLWCLSADFKKFWWSFTSLGKPKFEFLWMSLVHFIVRLIAIMSTVPRPWSPLHQKWLLFFLRFKASFMLTETRIRETLHGLNKKSQLSQKLNYLFSSKKLPPS